MKIEVISKIPMKGKLFQYERIYYNPEINNYTFDELRAYAKDSDQQFKL
jgi:hypothetical protein